MNLTLIHACANTNRMSRWNSSFDSLDGDKELLGSRIPEIRILKYCIEMNFDVPKCREKCRNLYRMRNFAECCVDGINFDIFM